MIAIPALTAGLGSPSAALKTILGRPTTIFQPTALQPFMPFGVSGGSGSPRMSWGNQGGNNMNDPLLSMALASRARAEGQALLENAAATKLLGILANAQGLLGLAQKGEIDRGRLGLDTEAMRRNYDVALRSLQVQRANRDATLGAAQNIASGANSALGSVLNVLPRLFGGSSGGASGGLFGLGSAPLFGVMPTQPQSRISGFTPAQNATVDTIGSSGDKAGLWANNINQNLQSLLSARSLANQATSNLLDFLSGRYRDYLAQQQLAEWLMNV